MLKRTWSEGRLTNLTWKLKMTLGNLFVFVCHSQCVRRNTPRMNNFLDPLNDRYECKKSTSPEIDHQIF